jgi:serine acetyltransferase
MNKEKEGRRKPIIGDNTLIGAGAKVLGSINNWRKLYN